MFAAFGLFRASPVSRFNRAYRAINVFKIGPKLEDGAGDETRTRDFNLGKEATASRIPRGPLGRPRSHSSGFFERRCNAFTPERNSLYPCRAYDQVWVAADLRPIIIEWSTAAGVVARRRG
jgi:hypothetical protein